MKNKLVKILFFAACVAGLSYSQVKQIKQFHEIIFTNTDGSADVEWIVKTESDSSSVIKLTYGFKNGSNYSFDSALIKTLLTVEENSTRYLVIKTAGAVNKKEFKINFRLKDFLNYEQAEEKEFGNISFKYKFINTSSLVIKDFKSEIIFPEGYVVTSVDESSPKVSSSKPESPFEIVSWQNRHGVAIKNTNMKIGDNASISFKTKKEQKSYIFLTVLLLAGVGYLFYFRDILIAPENGAKKNGQV